MKSGKIKILIKNKPSINENFPATTQSLTCLANILPIKVGWIYCFSNSKNKYLIGQTDNIDDKKEKMLSKYNLILAKQVKDCVLAEKLISNFLKPESDDLPSIKRIFDLFEGELYDEDINIVVTFIKSIFTPCDDKIFYFDKLNDMSDNVLKLLADWFHKIYPIINPNDKKILLITKICLFLEYTEGGRNMISDKECSFTFGNEIDIELTEKFNIDCSDQLNIDRYLIDQLNINTNFRDIIAKVNQLENCLTIFKNKKFKNGQKIRHRILTDIWEGIYDEETDKILYNNKSYDLISFSRKHNQISDYGKKIGINWDKECEYQLDNGLWLPVENYNIFFNNKREHNLYNKIMKKLEFLLCLDIPISQFRENEKIKIKESEYLFMKDDEYFIKNNFIGDKINKDNFIEDNLIDNKIDKDNFIEDKNNLIIDHNNEENYLTIKSLMNRHNLTKWTDIKFLDRNSTWKSLLDFYDDNDNDDYNSNSSSSNNSNNNN